MSEIVAVVETAVYVDDLEAAEAFYRGVLGLEVIGREAGRHVFFRVGDGVLLAFDPEATLKGEMLPPHGARGPGHFALGVRAEGLDEWRRRLEGHGVEIEKEMVRIDSSLSWIVQRCVKIGMAEIKRLPSVNDETVGENGAPADDE